MNFSSNLKSVLSPSFLIGTSILFGWTIIAIGATEFAPFDPMATVGGSRKPPSFEFLFGTDRLGRDVLSRIIYGSRISLLLGFVSVSIGAIIGTTLGLISGYYGRYVDTVIMRTIDAMLAFPGILLALVIIAALGASITNVMLAVGVSTIPRYARLVRSNVLLIRPSETIWHVRHQDTDPTCPS